MSMIVKNIVTPIGNLFKQAQGAVIVTPSTATSIGTKTVPQQTAYQQIKTGITGATSGQSGRVLVTGAKVGAGAGIAGAGLTYATQAVANPIEQFTQPIDQLTGLAGAGSLIIVGIIILVLIIILRGKI